MSDPLSFVVEGGWPGTWLDRLSVSLYVGDWIEVMGHSGRHVDGWLDQAEEQYKTYPLWKGVLAWVLLALVVALILG